MTRLRAFTGSRRTSGGQLRAVEEPVLAVLAMGSGPDAAVAVVGDLEVAAFTDGRVLPHETVDPDRVAELAERLRGRRIDSDPVCLTHRPASGVREVTRTIMARPPDVALTGADTGERGPTTSDGGDVERPVRLWVVDDPVERQELVHAVDTAGTLYLVDGHHRVAAIAAVEERAAPDRPARILTASVPCDQLRVEAFHRRLDGVGLPATDVVERLRDRGLVVEPLDSASAPTGPGRMTLTVDGAWWSIDARSGCRPDTADRLDVRLAEREVVTPLLTASASAGSAPDVVPVAAAEGLDALVRPGSIGIALHPESVDAMLAAADAGRSMPPKTTYVRPRLPTGLLFVPR